MRATSRARWLVLAALVAAPGSAQERDESDDLGVTMTVIGDERAEDEHEFVNEIELPQTVRDGESLPSAGSARGAEMAEEVRKRALELGRERAEEVRQSDTRRARPLESEGP